MNRRHDQRANEEAARKRVTDDAADASRIAVLEEADAEAQKALAEFRSLSPAGRIKRAREACQASAWCPNPTVDRILEAAASDDERAAVRRALQPIIQQKTGVGASRFSGMSTAQLKAVAERECRSGPCASETLEEIYGAAPEADGEYVRCVVRFEEDAWACRTGMNPGACNPPACHR